MDVIKVFLSNPIVSLVGYILSVISACIAIWQFREKKSAFQKLKKLKIEISNLTDNSNNITTSSDIKNKNTIHQGSKSQYFQDNSGSVNIDNRD